MIDEFDVGDKLDMVHETFSELFLADYFKRANYQHSPEIVDDIVLAYGSDEKLDGKCHSLIIYKDGTAIRTARPLVNLYADYGVSHHIYDWLPWQKTLAYLTNGASKLAPYVTVHSGFIQIHGGCFLNQNYVSGYERSQAHGQYGTHTTITLTTGATVELSLGYRSFQKKLHEAAALLIGLRKFFSHLTKKGRNQVIYEEPIKLNPFIRQDLITHKVSEPTFEASELKKAFHYFEYTQKHLEDLFITQEVLALFDPFTRELIEKEQKDEKGVSQNGT